MSSESSSPEPTSPRIMVVNDSQEILDLFEALLQDEGYETFLYSYALRDLDEVERVGPDLIILDYMIGGENLGWQLLQKLRMKRETAHLPVVICTAASQVVRETEGFLKAKDVQVVLKPFDIDEFIAVVKRALDAGPRTHLEQVAERSADESSSTESKSGS